MRSSKRSLAETNTPPVGFLGGGRQPWAELEFGRRGGRHASRRVTTALPVRVLAPRARRRPTTKASGTELHHCCTMLIPTTLPRFVSQTFSRSHNSCLTQVWLEECNWQLGRYISCSQLCQVLRTWPDFEQTLHRVPQTWFTKCFRTSYPLTSNKVPRPTRPIPVDTHRSTPPP